MTTIRAAILDDIPAITAIWGARAADPASCWALSESPDTDFLAALIGSDAQWSALALDGDTPIAFGFAAAIPPLAIFSGIAAPDDATYYRMVVAFCDWAISAGCSAARATLRDAESAERNLWDVLGVVTYAPIGYIPAANLGDRVPSVLAGDSVLLEVRVAALAKLA